MDDQDTKARLQSEQVDDSLETNREENTDASDNLTPDHPRFKDVIKERNEAREELERLRAEREELRNQVTQRQQNTGTSELTEEEELALSKIEKELEKRGFVNERVLKRENEITRLASEHNGNDGLPKFVAIDVIEFAKRNGYGDNYEAAYDRMHRDAIVQLEAKKYAQERGVPLSERPTGGERKNPIQQFTPEDISKMSPEEYETHRADLLAAIKPPKQ